MTKNLMTVLHVHVQVDIKLQGSRWKVVDLMFSLLQPNRPHALRGHVASFL